MTEKPILSLNNLPCLPIFPLFLVLPSGKCKKPTLVREGRGGHALSAEENSEPNSYCEKPDVIDNNSLINLQNEL